MLNVVTEPTPLNNGVGVMRTYAPIGGHDARHRQRGAAGQHGDDRPVAHALLQDWYSEQSLSRAVQVGAATGIRQRTELLGENGLIDRELFDGGVGQQVIGHELFAASAIKLERHQSVLLSQGNLVAHVLLALGAVVVIHIDRDFAGGDLTPHPSQQYPVGAIECLGTDIRLAHAFHGGLAFARGGIAQHDAAGRGAGIAE